MYAILNYYQNPRISNMEKVRVGDKVASKISDFDLTEGKQYQVVNIINTTIICIVNDKGLQEDYTVEYFIRR